MVRAADAARGGWEILATHLGASGLRPGGQALRSHAGVRAVLADTALLIRGVSELEFDIVQALRETAASPTARVAISAAWAPTVDPTNEPAATDLPSALRSVADDCVSSQDRGLTTSAYLALAVLSQPGRGGIDAVPPVGPSHLPQEIRTPEDAVAAVDAYHEWVVRYAADLTVTDVANIVAVGQRLAGLTGMIHQATNPTAGPAAAAAVDAWRACHAALRPFASLHPGPPGAGSAHRLAEWAQQAARHDVPDPAELPRWQRATAEIARRLPDLATAAEHSFFLLRRSRRILSPTGQPRRPGLPPPRERFRYQPARTDDDGIDQVFESLTKARTANGARLARAIGMSASTSTSSPVTASRTDHAPRSRGAGNQLTAPH